MPLTFQEMSFIERIYPKLGAGFQGKAEAPRLGGWAAANSAEWPGIWLDHRNGKPGYVPHADFTFDCQSSAMLLDELLAEQEPEASTPLAIGPVPRSVLTE